MNKNAEKSMRVMIPMSPELAAELKADQKKNDNTAYGPLNGSKIIMNIMIIVIY